MLFTLDDSCQFVIDSENFTETVSRLLDAEYRREHVVVINRVILKLLQNKKDIFSLTQCRALERISARMTERRALTKELKISVRIIQDGSTYSLGNGEIAVPWEYVGIGITEIVGEDSSDAEIYGNLARTQIPTGYRSSFRTINGGGQNTPKVVEAYSRNPVRMPIIAIPDTDRNQTGVTNSVLHQTREAIATLQSQYYVCDCTHLQARKIESIITIPLLKALEKNKIMSGLKTLIQAIETDFDGWRELDLKNAHASCRFSVTPCLGDCNCPETVGLGPHFAEHLSTLIMKSVFIENSNWFETFCDIWLDCVELVASYIIAPARS